MKTLFAYPFLLLATATAAVAADAHAVLVYEDDAEQVWITAASTLNVEYKTAPQGLNLTRKSRAEIKSIYFYEPPVFKEAIELFESRDYSGAKEKFAECMDAFKRVEDLPGNYSTLAGFYELECARKKFDLEGLKQLRDAYRFGSLVRENQRTQLEVYDVWDAVRTKSWPRLDSLATRLLQEKKWTNHHLAQIKYCHGLALEALDRPTEALIAFNGAFTADYTASEELTQKALLNCLRILQGHDEVKLAISLWGTDDEDKNSTGYLLLQEAISLCDLWKQALGGGQALPAEYVPLLKYRGSGELFEGNKKKAAEEDKKADGKKADDKTPDDKTPDDKTPDDKTPADKKADEVADEKADEKPDPKKDEKPK